MRLLTENLLEQTKEALWLFSPYFNCYIWQDSLGVWFYISILHAVKLTNCNLRHMHQEHIIITCTQSFNTEIERERGMMVSCSYMAILAIRPRLTIGEKAYQMMASLGMANITMGSIISTMSYVKYFFCRALCTDHEWGKFVTVNIHAQLNSTHARLPCLLVQSFMVPPLTKEGRVQLPVQACKGQGEITVNY